MSVRQYIGARYVPKFFDNNGSSEWVSGLTYEALTIVTYLNNCFIAKKPVPAGIGAPNLNTTYWANVGIQQQDIIELENRMDAAEENIEDAAIRASEGGIGPDDNVIVVSDSYGANNINFVTYLENITGANIINLSEGGAAYSARTGYHTYQEILTAATIPIPKTDVTAIIVGGGANDYNHEYVNIEYAVSQFCAYCKTNYPNAMVYVFFAGSYKCVNSDYQSRQYNCQHVVKPAVMSGVVNHRNAMFVDGADKAFTFLDSFSADNLHPNEIGCKRIAQFLYNSINNSAVSKARPGSIVLSIAEQTSSDNLTLSVLDNGQSYVLFNSANVVFQLTPTSYNYRRVPFTIESNTTNLNLFRSMVFPISAVYRMNSLYYQGVALFEINATNAGLTFSISENMMLADGSGYLALTDLAQLQVNPFTITIPKLI